MADDQKQPPASPLSTPASTASLDDVLSSLEQQVQAGTPIAQATTPLTSPVVEPVAAAPVNASEIVKESIPAVAPTIPPMTEIPTPVTAPVVEQPVVAPLSSAEPPTAALSEQPISSTPFGIEEKHVEQAEQPPAAPVSQAVEADMLKEHPAMDTTAVSPTPQETPTPIQAPSKGFFSFLNPKFAIAGVLTLFVIVGSVAAFMLSQTGQDLRQRAAGGGQCVGPGTANCPGIGPIQCGGRSEANCKNVGAIGCGCSWQADSGGGSTPTPTQPPGGGGGSSVCYPGSPSSVACRNGNTFGSPCTNFAGTCQKGALQPNGQYACACVPTQALPNGSSCTANSNCQSGYCNPSTNKCDTPPASNCNAPNSCVSAAACSSGSLGILNCLSGQVCCRPVSTPQPSTCVSPNSCKSAGSCSTGSIGVLNCLSGQVCCKPATPAPTAAPTAPPGGQTPPPGSTCGGNNQNCCDPFSTNGAICYNNLYCNTSTGKCQSAVPAGICQQNGGTPSGKCQVFKCGNSCNNGSECNLGGQTVDCSAASLDGQCGQIDYLNTNNAYCGVKVQNCGGSCRGTSTPPPTKAPTPTPVAQCNSTCTSNAQCPSGLTCSSGKCRRAACLSSTNCVCATATPSPTPTPTPSPTPTVTPPPLACLNITRDIQNPELGNQVRFTCGTVAGADRYEFRYKYSFNGGAEVGGTLSATGNISAPLTISQPGNYKAQCRVCIGQACSEWEAW